MQTLNTESSLRALPVVRSVDPWAVLTGGSVGIVVGFGVDLFRLGIHAARQLLCARSGSPCAAAGGWRGDRRCDAGAR